MCAYVCVCMCVQVWACVSKCVRVCSTHILPPQAHHGVGQHGHTLLHLLPRLHQLVDVVQEGWQQDLTTSCVWDVAAINKFCFSQYMWLNQEDTLSYILFVTLQDLRVH